MTVSTVLEIGALSLAAIAGIIEFVRSSEAPAAKIARSLILSLLILIAGTVLIIRWEIIPRIEKNQDETREIARTQELKTTQLQKQQELHEAIGNDEALKNLAELWKSADTAARTAPAIFQESLRDRANEFSSNLREIATKQITVPRDDIVLTASKLIRQAKKLIVGTSYVRKSDWWDTPEGQQYLALHAQLLKQGVKIRRIFVFSSDKEMESAKPLMIIQRKMGVEVRYIFVADLPTYTDDMITIDSTISGELTLDPDKGMKYAKFYCDEQHFQRISLRLDHLINQARELK